ncbi:uncharacterized protein LOC129586584 isoform X2 [Paramacrobiotus metropolitanus]|uniref:uncharacterized protein LOC129586584 isoform X2 n=1 Tax=Paramacrobiotus metropolitanus TaxID=2943436 RepID=UPI0024457A63|nr:uncharacterized protein LOC129586584 isoform X2 [Paramacrobiotus metropolitanus]
MAPRYIQLCSPSLLGQTPLTLLAGGAHCYQACRNTLRARLLTDDFRLVFRTMIGQKEHSIECQSETDLQNLLHHGHSDEGGRDILELHVVRLPRRAHGSAAGSNADDATALSVQITVGHMWNAVKLMLPKENEVPVLRGMIDQMTNRIASRTAERSPSPHPGNAVPRESDGLQHVLDTPGSNGGINRGRVDGFHSIVASHRASDTVENYGSRGSIHGNLEPALNQRPLVQDLRKAPKRVHFAELMGARSSVVASADRRKQAKQGIVQHKQRSSTLPSSSQPLMVMTMPPPLVQPGAGEPIVERVSASNKFLGYKCPMCPQRKAIKREMTMHMAFHGSAGPLSCPRCNFATDNRKRFNHHVKVHQQEEAEQEAAVMSAAAWGGADAAMRNPSVKGESPSEASEESPPSDRPFSGQLLMPRKRVASSER